MLRLTNLIAGDSVPPASGRFLSVLEPAAGRPWAEVPDSGPEDVDRAVRAAAGAFPAWSGLPAATRAGHLQRLADLIDANLDQLAEAESRDTGKPIGLARAVDIPRSSANLRYFAAAVQHTVGELHEFDGAGTPGAVPALNYTLRRPRGPAGLISPWNLPLYLLTWKIAPALATGNTAVCKPSEVTPVTAFMLGELSRQAGLPPGVLNIVHGQGRAVGAALVEHPDVPAVSFTGSTPVGRWIGERAGGLLKRVSLELGGKNPFIVFDDADLDAALDTAVRAAFTNQGQICLCGSRLLVHRGVYGRLVPRLVERARALPIGDPLEAAAPAPAGPRQGALVSADHLAKVAGMVDQARSLGGRVLCGGQRVEQAALPARCRDGLFYLPTVIEGLDPMCAVEQQEIFGPVVTVQPFDNDDQALALANGTPYGLAATVFTSNVRRAHRFGAELKAGIVWVNCWMVRDLRTPFGGVKASGVGREGGLEAIKFFTEPTNVCVAR